MSKDVKSLAHMRASMKMERFFSENGTDVSRTIKTNHIGFL